MLDARVGNRLPSFLPSDIASKQPQHVWVSGARGVSKLVHQCLLTCGIRTRQVTLSRLLEGATKQMTKTERAERPSGGPWKSVCGQPRRVTRSDRIKRNPPVGIQWASSEHPSLLEIVRKSPMAYVDGVDDMYGYFPWLTHTLCVWIAWRDMRRRMEGDGSRPHPRRRDHSRSSRVPAPKNTCLVHV